MSEATTDDSPACRMEWGRCPEHAGHVVMRDNDCFRCTSCGDTGWQPCLCATCPDRRAS